LSCWRSGARSTKNQSTVLIPKGFHSELTVLADANASLENNMVDRFFLNGCSFNTYNRKGGIDTFVGKIVAEHFELPWENFSRGGRGNYRICTTTKMWFEKTKSDNAFALIEWTSPFRRDFPSADGWKPIPGYNTTWRTWTTISNLPWTREGKKSWDLEQEHSLFMLNCILDMQWYFKAKNIPYVMYHGLDGEIQTNFADHKLLWESVDHKRFFKPFDSHYEEIQRTGQYVSKNDFHPNYPGHRMWAKELIQHIEENDLLNI